MISCSRAGGDPPDMAGLAVQTSVLVTVRMMERKPAIQTGSYKQTERNLGVGIDVDEFDVHDVFGLKLLRAGGRLPLEKGDALDGDVFVVNPLVEQIARPFGHHQRDHDRKTVTDMWN